MTGLKDLAIDPRFSNQLLRARNQKVLANILQVEFEKKKVMHWLDEFDRRGVPCSPINSYPQLLDSEQIKHMRLVRDLTLPNGIKTQTLAFPISITDYEFEIFKPPPNLGEHNEMVVSDWLDKKNRRFN